MIEGYCERDAIATFASENLKDTIVFYPYLSDVEVQKYVDAKGRWNSYNALNDNASVYTCFNVLSSEVQKIFQKYNVSYIFTRRYDKQIASIFFRWFNKNTSVYINDYNLTDLAKQTLIFQMWSGDYVPFGLELVYSLPPDNYVYYDRKFLK